MKLIREPYVLTEEQVERVEKLKNAKWVLDTEHNGVPVSVFWQETPHPEGSNFFALYYAGFSRQLMITDGSFILDQEIQGLMLPNGDVIYSRHRHDYFERDGVAVDGGRAYFRAVGVNPMGIGKSATIRVTKWGTITVEIEVT